MANAFAPVIQRHGVFRRPVKSTIRVSQGDFKDFKDFSDAVAVHNYRAEVPVTFQRLLDRLWRCLEAEEQDARLAARDDRLARREERRAELPLTPFAATRADYGSLKPLPKQL